MIDMPNNTAAISAFSRTLKLNVPINERLGKTGGSNLLWVTQKFAMLVWSGRVPIMPPPSGWMLPAARLG
jgi:hypothetical protein